MDSSSTADQTIKLTQLDIKVKYSFEERHRHSLLFDKTGNCEVFFRYKAHLVEVNKLSIGISLGRTTRDEAVETLRKSLVYCMRAGERLVLDCGNIAVDFKGLFDTPGSFPVDQLFNFKEWRKEENYMKVVRDDENHDLMGNKKCYMMNDSFHIVILQNNEDDQETADELRAFIGANNVRDSFDTYIVS